jgi:soluble lytic murein transglycosylase
MRLARLTALALAATAALGVARAELPLPADSGAAVSVPMEILSPSDVALYRQVFAAERAGRFDDAKDLYAKISDRSLEGYVLAEHYLSPHGHVTVAELVEWMHQYTELPIADRVYSLAVKRASKRVKKRHHVIAIVMTASVPVPAGPARRRGGGYEEFDPSDPPLTSDAARAVLPQIEKLIKAGQPEQAYDLVRQAQDNGAAPYDLSRLIQRVSASFLAEGMDQRAYDASMGVKDDMRLAVPVLDWYSGFAAYRLGNYEQAAARLETLAASRSIPNYLRSQAAFWASRAELRYGDPQRVITLLQSAAREQPTFYGLLAEQILGVDTKTGFRDPVLTAADFSVIMASPAARRAVALTQVGEERDSAAGELNRAFGESDGSHDMGYAAMARRMNASNIELRASETAAARGIPLTGLFPVPGYKPDGGYTIDPSLVLAFVRCESRFIPEAVSPAGARGLMQLMPATAAKFGGNGAISALNDPTYNMSIGQRYIAYLLDTYGGNLVQVPAVYNAGPLRLAQWINARAGKEDDALEFIESIGISETRFYVKRLLMYHWLYSRRLGQPTPTLGQTAAGQWPVYHAPTQPPAPRPPAVMPPQDNQVISDARY